MRQVYFSSTIQATRKTRVPQIRSLLRSPHSDLSPQHMRQAAHNVQPLCSSREAIRRPLLARTRLPIVLHTIPNGSRAPVPKFLRYVSSLSPVSTSPCMSLSVRQYTMAVVFSYYSILSLPCCDPLEALQIGANRNAISAALS